MINASKHLLSILDKPKPETSLEFYVPWLLALGINKVASKATKAQRARTDARIGTTRLLCFFFMQEVEIQRSGFPSTL